MASHKHCAEGGGGVMPPPETVEERVRHCWGEHLFPFSGRELDEEIDTVLITKSTSQHI